MNFNEIQELIKLMNKSNLSEFKMKEKDFEILIRTEKYHKGTPTVVAAPAVTPSVSIPSPQMITQTSSAKAEDVAPAPQPAVASKNIVEISPP